MRQLVLARIANDEHRTSEAAFFSIAWPCGLKMPPFIPSRSLRLHAGFSWYRTNQKDERGAGERCVETGRSRDVRQHRERAVVELHHDAGQRGHGGLDLQQSEHDRLVRPEQLAGPLCGTAMSSRSGRLRR